MQPDRSGVRTGRETKAIVARIMALVGFTGPVLYIALTTILGLLWEGYDPIRQTQSGLGASDAPQGLLMNVAGFMGLGVTMLACAGAYALVVRGSAWTVLAVAALLVAGIGMIMVGFFPCDPGCVDVSRTGELHSAFSMPGAIGLPAAAMLSAPAFRADGRFGPSWQAVSLVIGLLALASGPIVAAEMVSGYDGLLQRTAMWTPILWMSAVSLRFYGLGLPQADPRAGIGTVRSG